MPPRKRRGRAKKASGGSKKQAVEETRDEEDVQLASLHVPETVDAELLRAQSTIERLTKKYLHKSFEASSRSLDIVKGDSTILNEPEQNEAMEAFGEGGREDTSSKERDGGSKEGEERHREEQGSKKDEEKENRADELLANVSREAVNSLQLGPVAKKGRVAELRTSAIALRRARHPRATKRTAVSKSDNEKASLGEIPRETRFSSPGFKLPQPTMGHSTPDDVVPGLPSRRDSLFGFGALESPLVLSPVQVFSLVADQDTENMHEHNKSIEDNECDSIKKLLGTYDIPLRKQNAKNKKRQTKQRAKRQSFEEEEWIKKLTSEFTEVDNFELAIE